MTVVRTALEVDASPEDVWAVVTDPANLPHWDRHIESVEAVPKAGLSPGATYVVVVRLMRVRARVRAEILEWSPPSHARIRLSGPVDATVDTVVDPLPGGRSLLRHEVDYRFRGGAFGRLAARSLRVLGGAGYELRHGAMAQKRDAEAG
jgi:carbon monoxide dehydrogenase subunit G